MLNARYANLEQGFLPAHNYEIPNAGERGESVYTVPPPALEASALQHDSGSPRRAQEYVSQLDQSLRGSLTESRPPGLMMYSQTPVKSPYAGRGPLSGVR